MDQIASLTQRVYRLEQEVARLKGAPLRDMEAIYGAPPVRPPTEIPLRIEQPADVPVAVDARPQPAARALDASLESEVAGTWFARIGAVALLLGAGFAFKYGIDRGLIGPGLRVTAGLIAGLALIAAGEWSHRRSWPVFAQSVAAAGTSLLVLSIWAAYHLYSMIGAAPAFTALFSVTVITGGLAIRHDSQALAILATIGGILDPIIVGGRSQPAALFGYLLVLDAGVLAVSMWRRWAVPSFVAFAGTWLLFAVAADEASLGVAFGYATALFALFTAPTFARYTSDDDAAAAALATLNAAAYFFAGVALLGRDAEQWRGAFAAAVGALHLWAGGAAWTTERNRITATTVFIIGQVFLAAAVPLHLHGTAIPVGWAIEAVAFVWLGRAARMPVARTLGAVLMAFSAAETVLGEFQLSRTYEPERLLISPESLAMFSQVAGAYFIAWLLRSAREEMARQAAIAALVGANALTVIWLSFEAVARHRAGLLGQTSTALPFTLSAIWGLYAALLLAIGFILRKRGIRLMSLALFGATIVKMALVDLWLLQTGYRVLAFLGLGVILLIASLTYHRFRDLIAGDEEKMPAVP